jgi:PKD repeat protein
MRTRTLALLLGPLLLLTTACADQSVTAPQEALQHLQPGHGDGGETVVLSRSEYASAIESGTCEEQLSFSDDRPIVGTTEWTEISNYWANQGTAHRSPNGATELVYDIETVSSVATFRVWVAAGYINAGGGGPVRDVTLHVRHRDETGALRSTIGSSVYTTAHNYGWRSYGIVSLAAGTHQLGLACTNTSRPSRCGFDGIVLTTDMDFDPRVDPAFDPYRTADWNAHDWSGSCEGGDDPPPPAGDGPTASFTYQCHNTATCQFTDTSTPGGSAIGEWLWTSSDGQSATTQNTAFTFTAAGSHTLMLRVTDANGRPDDISAAVNCRTHPNQGLRCS